MPLLGIFEVVGVQQYVQYFFRCAVGGEFACEAFFFQAAVFVDELHVVHFLQDTGNLLQRVLLEGKYAVNP